MGSARPIPRRTGQDAPAACAATTAEILDYIADSLREFVALAETQRLDTLAYLLDMARLEAESRGSAGHDEA